MNYTKPTEELKPCPFCGSNAKVNPIDMVEHRCNTQDEYDDDMAMSRIDWQDAYCWKVLATQREKFEKEKAELLYVAGFLAQFNIDDPVIKATPDLQGWIKKGREFFMKTQKRIEELEKAADAVISHFGWRTNEEKRDFENWQRVREGR